MAASGTTTTTRAKCKPTSAAVCLLLFLSTWPAATGQVVRLRRPVFRPDRLQPIFVPGGEPRASALNISAVPLPAPVPVGPLELPTTPTGSRPPLDPPEPHPKPGNIVVHLDADQEINRIEYMLRDGQLATVYTRRAHNASENTTPHTNDKRQEIQYAPSSITQPPPPPPPGPLLLAPFQGEPIQLQQPPQGAPGPSVATIDFQDGEHLDQGHDPNELMAQLPGAAQVQEPARRPNRVGAFIKSIKAKLRRLPKIVQKKLQGKSTLGKLFFDGAVRVSGAQNPQVALVRPNGDPNGPGPLPLLPPPPSSVEMGVLAPPLGAQLDESQRNSGSIRVDADAKTGAQAQTPSTSDNNSNKLSKQELRSE